MTRLRPYCVGLTGGIGSGKSLVARMFGERGAGIVDTDVIARTITAPGGAAIASLRAAFGPDFIAQDGGLDRARMRALVFADPAARHRLEGLLHPMIRARAAAELVDLGRFPYVVLVVPLLVETAAYGELYDRVLVVDCEPGQQLARVVQRDGLAEATVRAVMAAQAGREARLAAADDVIDNRGAAASLATQVDVLHRAYAAAAGRH
ncbi:dephospho-CoA kinase [Parasulfuritortus cantonensis]|uniref:Dephospho-CoA kinase n=1 Tax=Parasulfuritortus cantonensis TaxID=2528202 RepID=A0A4V2NW77_9PROT|nr:dephospho-CoA kinase [Parasulfuritortus cantonensis]TCJ16332.1 dephospho-CoA kinase [Parasulfuritortus cantonensis]